MTKRILIFHYNKVTSYPPVISLVQNLLNNGNSVCLISFNSSELPDAILKNQKFKYIDISFNYGHSLINILKRKLFLYHSLRALVNKEMSKYDLLWTTTDYSVKVLGDTVLKYKHVMQLMELEKRMPLFGASKFFSYPIDKYARSAWKVVVPEINRAYIQKAWWNLKSLPIILPNKPYRINYKENGFGERKVTDYFNDDRKIILYLGFIGADRDLTSFAEAVGKLDPSKYCLYIVGRVDDKWKDRFAAFLDKYKFVRYLGYFPAPSHLAFLKKAHIGILPYYVNNKHPYLSPLNTLYCAPNKIFEYAGFSVPMIGTDVLGLRDPFEKYNIGMCVNDKSVADIVAAIRKIDSNYSIMKDNCERFYNSVDLDDIVDKIISE